jgi:hypothetical protein
MEERVNPPVFVYLLSVSPGLCCVDLGTPSAGHDSLPDFVAADPDLDSFCTHPRKRQATGPVKIGISKLSINSTDVSGSVSEPGGLEFVNPFLHIYTV